MNVISRNNNSQYKEIPMLHKTRYFRIQFSNYHIQIGMNVCFMYAYTQKIYIYISICTHKYTRV